MELIDKSALVAEIERRKKIVEKRLYINNSYSEEGNAAWERDKALYDAYNSLLSSLDTLEVKDFWKSADGDDLPEIDREVVALLGNGKVGFAHRPPEYWDGKNIITGKVTRNYPKTYDKGGWNIPNVAFWLDLGIPKL